MAGFQVLSFSRRKILGLKAFLVKKALASSVTNSGSRATLFFLKLFPWKVITYSLPNAWATLYLPASQNSSPVKFTLSPLPVHLVLCTWAGDRSRGCNALRQDFPLLSASLSRAQVGDDSNWNEHWCSTSFRFWSVGKLLCNVCQGNAI